MTLSSCGDEVKDDIQGSIADNSTIIIETTMSDDITTASVPDTKTVLPQTTAAVITEVESEIDHNTLLTELKIDFDDDIAAVLINAPTDDMLKIAGEYEEYFISDSEPPSLIIPVNPGTDIEILPVKDISDKGELIYDKPSYSKEDCSDGYSILISSIRPEGMPTFCIKFTYDGQDAIYHYTYNGRTGNVGNEYIKFAE